MVCIAGHILTFFHYEFTGQTGAAGWWFKTSSSVFACWINAYWVILLLYVKLRRDITFCRLLMLCTTWKQVHIWYNASVLCLFIAQQSWLGADYRKKIPIKVCGRKRWLKRGCTETWGASRLAGVKEQVIKDPSSRFELAMLHWAKVLS